MSRITEIRESHPYLHPGHVRMMLIHAYKKAFTDPTCGRTSSALETRLEAFTRAIKAMSEGDVRNELSRALEWFPGVTPDEFISDDEANAYYEYLNNEKQ